MDPLVAARAGRGLGATLLTNEARAGDTPAPSVDTSTAAYRPNVVFAFDVPKLGQAVRVDGVLDDPVWQNAAKLTGFVEVEPGDNCRPQAETEALMVVD